MKQKKKLLIISVSAGAGHVRIAQALEKTAKIHFPNYEVKHIDMMDYVSLPIKKAIVDTYSLLIKNAPAIWGFLYKQSDDNVRLEKGEKIISKGTHIGAKKFYAFLDEYNPDTIICTHPFPAQAIKRSLKKEHQNIPVSIVVTDYGLHALWLVKNIHTYFVATEHMARQIQKTLKDQKVIVSGIPVQPEFFEHKDINSLREKYAIPQGKKVILLLSGGHGMVRIDTIAKYLLTHITETPIHIIAVAGKNLSLKKKLDTITHKDFKENSCESLGWTNAVDEYMRIADVIITKPGGSTTTECSVLQKPIIAISPIPGQEELNTEYIVQNKLGYKATTLLDLEYSTKKILEEKNKVKKEKVSNAGQKILENI
ncbi:MAG: glycosyltransferase [Candidatus Magasanikbacteria bacterium]